MKQQNTTHNYGLEEVYSKYTFSGKPIMNQKPFEKRVLVINLEECENRITVREVRNRLMGSGWSEWEVLLANMLVERIANSIENDLDEADITDIFSCELYGESFSGGSFTKPQSKVQEFLLGRIFCIAEDNAEELLLIYKF